VDPIFHHEFRPGGIVRADANAAVPFDSHRLVECAAAAVSEDYLTRERIGVDLQLEVLDAEALVGAGLPPQRARAFGVFSSPTDPIR
jgi:hypothetical protein